MSSEAKTGDKKDTDELAEIETEAAADTTEEHSEDTSATQEKKDEPKADKKIYLKPTVGRGKRDMALAAHVKTFVVGPVELTDLKAAWLQNLMKSARQFLIRFCTWEDNKTKGHIELQFKSTAAARAAVVELNGKKPNLYAKNLGPSTFRQLTKEDLDDRDREVRGLEGKDTSESRTLVVSPLADDETEEHVHELIPQAAEVYIPRNDSDKSIGYGYAVLANHDDLRTLLGGKLITSVSYTEEVEDEERTVTLNVVPLEITDDLLLLDEDLFAVPPEKEKTEEEQKKEDEKKAADEKRRENDEKREQERKEEDDKKRADVLAEREKRATELKRKQDELAAKELSDEDRAKEEKKLKIEEETEKKKVVAENKADERRQEAERRRLELKRLAEEKRRLQLPGTRLMEYQTRTLRGQLNALKGRFGQATANDDHLQTIIKQLQNVAAQLKQDELLGDDNLDEAARHNNVLKNTEAEAAELKKTLGSADAQQRPPRGRGGSRGGPRGGPRDVPALVSRGGGGGGRGFGRGPQGGAYRGDAYGDGYGAGGGQMVDTTRNALNLIMGLKQVMSAQTMGGFGGGGGYGGGAVYPGGAYGGGGGDNFRKRPGGGGGGYSGGAPKRGRGGRGGGYGARY